ncbi:MAG: lytic transglycosylase domain-containing protein [Deltaproteobacteria bacterium]|nr:lytic transglycosylase domain-containing protein [Deltaproteobacteria bacterium]
MSKFTFYVFLKALKIRTLFALSALGLAVYPVWQEHLSRLNMITVLSQIPVEVPPSVGPVVMSNYSSGLTPTSQILDQVKKQANVPPVLDKKAEVYEDLILAVSEENEVSPALIRAVIQAESKFNHQAVSAQGAVGLMQVLPSTAKSVGVLSPQTPRDNLKAGVRYLKVLLNQFDDDERLALAAYNCGPDVIRRYGNQMPPFRETRKFVSLVLEYYHSQIDS